MALSLSISSCMSWWSCNTFVSRPDKNSQSKAAVILPFLTTKVYLLNLTCLNDTYCYFDECPLDTNKTTFRKIFVFPICQSSCFPSRPRTICWHVPRRSSWKKEKGQWKPIWLFLISLRHPWWLNLFFVGEREIQPRQHTVDQNRQEKNYYPAFDWGILPVIGLLQQISVRQRWATFKKANPLLTHVFLLGAAGERTLGTNTIPASSLAPWLITLLYGFWWLLKFEGELSLQSLVPVNCLQYRSHPEPVLTWTENIKKWESGAADLNVGRFDARHQDSVTLHKLHKCVSDGVTGTSDPDGLHHAGVSQLTDTQLPVK